MSYLNDVGLKYLWDKIKNSFGATLSVSGQEVSLKNKVGTTLSTITTQDTTYSEATTSAKGLMSSADKIKLNNISSGATANTITTKTVTIPVSSWSSKEAYITVDGVGTDDLLLVSVDSNSYGIQANIQAENMIIFNCTTTPTTAVKAQVAIIK